GPGLTNRRQGTQQVNVRNQWPVLPVVAGLACGLPRLPAPAPRALFLDLGFALDQLVAGIEAMVERCAGGVR
ncbi:hypothetical protein ABZV75_37385, partial [Streptomyces flaveolus]|uniref:hypothetical protein n=1 Tax=Streptomyces flaveolus TaxID=67297 RepID=UPI0033A989DF